MRIQFVTVLQTIRKMILFIGFLCFVLSTKAVGNPKEVIASDTAFFTDASCSELKKSFKSSHLKKMKDPLLKKVAQSMLKKEYNLAYRATSYEAYTSIQTVGKDLKIGDGFSRYQNITGMYLDGGEAIIMVGNTGNKKISLLIPYWMRKPAEGVVPTKDPNGWGLKRQEVELKEGVNIVNLERAGNAYISYFDDEPETAPKIKVHFLTGKVNGYFDSRIHSNEDWNRLLDNAVSPIMDAVGEHIQVAYPVEWFKKYTYNQGKELMANYDRMLHLEYKLMGLVKYNKIPKNKILARVNFNYYMFRDGDGVAYLGDASTMKMVATPSVVVSGDPCWGFCHEVGHVLQIRPQMTWGGMTEVSNNIFTMYVGTALGNASRLKNQDNFAKARKSIIESSPKISYLQDPDFFNRLVPFWQLQLYFSQQGYADFYADLMEEMRNRPDAGMGDESINNMFEFMKMACAVSNTDLTDFFDKWGFFYVGKIELDDYKKYNYTIKAKQVEAVKAYIASKKYPKPTIDITQLTD